MYISATKSIKISSAFFKHVTSSNPCEKVLNIKEFGMFEHFVAYCNWEGGGGGPHGRQSVFLLNARYRPYANMGVVN